ncbi:unnamed protein product [Brassicogethes aeneus]|uniref:Lipase domain-containing protein n=1 Tax=Brassicogethes aeneus TaxID=1431903 RepID=A0A9P0AT89_BRAAE|nr:unnamed protein product [Brassicogethes aeneus]
MWLKILFLIYCVKKISATRLFDTEYVPDESDVTFHLYHSSDFSEDDELFIDNPKSIKTSKFDPNIPTRFIIHGWTHSRDVPWIIELRELMASRNYGNIIVVDWGKLAHSMYVETREHTVLTSKQLARLLIFLARDQKIHMSSVHLIGHSMGGQISASAAYQVQQALGQKIGRITGLDPASPLFEWPEPDNLNELLDSSDALFVDVIHTNSGHLGMVKPAGHVDYYPNGGDDQPGCGFWVCSHIRAVEYFTASIRKPDLFKAYPYSSWEEYLERDTGNLNKRVGVPMGWAANPSIPIGCYYFKTHGEEQEYIMTKTTIEDSEVEYL